MTKIVSATFTLSGGLTGQCGSAVSHPSVINSLELVWPSTLSGPAGLFLERLGQKKVCHPTLGFSLPGPNPHSWHLDRAPWMKLGCTKLCDCCKKKRGQQLKKLYINHASVLYPSAQRQVTVRVAGLFMPRSCLCAAQQYGSFGFHCCKFLLQVLFTAIISLHGWWSFSNCPKGVMDGINFVCMCDLRDLFSEL